MRLLLKIVPKQNTPQPLNNYFLQSFFYTLLKETNFARLHNEKRYKYFCFSNIFPYKTNQALKQNEVYNLIFSSPQVELISNLKKQLNKQTSLRFGKYRFILEETKRVAVKIDENSILKTGTPVVISLTEKLCHDYDVPYKVEAGRPLYWNQNMPFNAFVEAVSKNSIRKYNEYFGKNLPEDLSLFRAYKFLRGALVDYKGGKIAGSLWQLWPVQDKKVLNVLQLILDIGLGEKNSAGFGFLNIVTK